MKKFLCLLALCVLACSAPPSTPPPDQAAGAASGAGGAMVSSASSSSTSSTSGATDGSGGAGGGACIPSDLCGYTCGGWPHPKPSGCICTLECPPPSAPCKQVVCDGVALPDKGGTCGEIQRAPGIWCASGVGTCDAQGACVLPAGTCDPPGTPRIWCTLNNADCDDGNPCTKNLCLGAWCANEPEPDGTPCGAGKACHAGVCCAP